MRNLRESVEQRNPLKRLFEAATVVVTLSITALPAWLGTVAVVTATSSKADADGQHWRTPLAAGKYLIDHDEEY